jgi:hypothetical protein
MAAPTEDVAPEHTSAGELSPDDVAQMDPQAILKLAPSTPAAVLEKHHARPRRLTAEHLSVMDPQEISQLDQQEVHAALVELSQNPRRLPGQTYETDTTGRVIAVHSCGSTRSPSHRATSPRRPRRVPRARARARRSPAAKRAGPTSSDDPSEPGEPEPPRLRLAPPPRAVLSFGCLTTDERGAS